MKLVEAKRKFIDSWGTFGTKWGINRTMALVHGLLLVSDEPLSSEDIMDDLKISRGNVNMNVRALVNWGLAQKVVMSGERMEYFVAEKDIHKVVTYIMRERKKRELEPVRSTLSSLKNVDDKGKSAQNFKKLVKDIDEFAGFADRSLERMINTDKAWFLKMMTKVFG